MNIDAVDRQIIQATQAGLPLVAQPYQAVAEELGLPVEDVMQRLARMQRDGIIRRIAAVPNHYKLGYRYNGMTVWDVADRYVDSLGRKCRIAIRQPLLPTAAAFAGLALQSVRDGAWQDRTRRRAAGGGHRRVIGRAGPQP